MPAKTLHDQAVIHRVGLEKYSNALVQSVMALLERVNKDIVAKISLTDFSERQSALGALEALLKEVRFRQAEGWVEISGAFESELDDLAGVETDFSRKLLASAAKLTGETSLSVELQSQKLSLSQVVAAVKARPFQGKLLSEWLNDADESQARRVKEALRQGWVQGEATSEIVRRVRGSRAAKYSDGILEINRRGAEAMVRTAITHVSSVAANEVYEAAGDIITGIRWVSTLDSRTTIICASLSDTVFPKDKGPRPPAHINCRSTTTPVLRGMKEFERTTYADWFKGQPEDVQNDILGPTRAALFRDGKLPLDRFINDRQQVLTLDQLRERDAASFARAGL